MCFTDVLKGHDWKATSWNMYLHKPDGADHDYYFPQEGVVFNFAEDGGVYKVTISGSPYDPSTKDAKEAASYELSEDGLTLSATFERVPGRKITESVFIGSNSNGMYLGHEVEFWDGAIATWRCDP